MRPLGIFAWGAAALVAASCGARTPFDDAEPGAAGGTSGRGSTSAAGPGSTTTGNAVTGSGTTGPTSGTSTGTTTSGSSGVGGFGTGSGSSGGTTTGSTTTGGNPTGGTTVGGVGGSSTTSTATSTTGGGFGGRSGTGGAGGLGGRSGTGGAGGFGGRGGRGSGGGIVIDAGNTINPLLSILPRVQPTARCDQCVDLRCNGTAACSNDPGCLAGTQCFFTVCASVPDQLPCAIKCFNGNIGQMMAAFEAVSCVYGACGVICTGGMEP